MLSDKNENFALSFDIISISISRSYFNSNLAFFFDKGTGKLYVF